MNWFKRKYSACKECGVHFDPAPKNEARWGHLCKEHRKPVMERDMRRDSVLSWAVTHWEKVEELMKEEARKEHARFQEAMQKGLNSMAVAAQEQTICGIGMGAGLQNRQGGA